MSFDVIAKAKEMTFSFISTRSDLLDAFDAAIQNRTGMRPWIRYAVVAVGLLWLSGFALVLVYGWGSAKWWQPIAWLVLGLAITWFLGLKPILGRRAIAQQSIPEQKLDILFSENGVTVSAYGAEEHQRNWEDFIGLYRHKKGLLFYMSDGTRHWLPDRVFNSRKEMEDLAEYVEAHCREFFEETREP